MCCKTQKEMVQRLASLGYTQFKMVRQHIYNLVLQPDAPWSKVPKWACSGPFGHEAVDFQHGLLWRSQGSMLALLDDLLDSSLLVIEVRANYDWFDMHAM